MKLKRKLAGFMALAMTAASLPGGLPSAPGTVRAAETGGMPQAKYAMPMDGSLELTGDSYASAKLVSAGLASSTDSAAFADGRSGQAYDTAGKLGIELENVAVDDTYTVSTWVNLQSPLGKNCPVLFVVNPKDGGNWLGMAGIEGSETFQVWYQNAGNGNVSIGTAAYELNTWVNYTLSVDGTTAVLYKNGEKVMSGTGEQIRNTANPKNIVLGSNSWSGDGVADCLFDDVRIYDEALDEAQAQALYNGGTGISLSASYQSIRPGKSTEITANTIGWLDGDSISWESSNPAVADVNAEGTVTGITSGTSVITAKLMREGETAASAEIEITVLQEKGNLIAEFTFDDEESGFEGAQAVAVKANDAAGLDIVNVEGRGNVLQFSGQPGGNYNWLNVTKNDEEKSRLLDGVKEFTVSYDSVSNGAYANNWVFFADEEGAAASEVHYIGILDSQDSITINRRAEDISNIKDSSVSAEWKHVDVVFGENKTELYVNGVLLAGRDNTYTVHDCLGDNSIIMIGKSTWGNEYWNGMLDNYKIYDYALTAEEIASTPVSSVTVSSASGATTVYAGNTLQLNAAAAPEDASDKSVEWTSSNPEVATVDDSGLVTAKAAGDVTITATAKDKDGKSGSIDLTVKAALTHHDRVEATCAKDGNVEYWSDEDGNKYLDAAGIQPIDEVTIPATGKHDYSITWNWVKTDGDYTATAVFKCKICQEESEPVQAEVSKQDGTDVTTYTAKAVFNEQEYTATKELAKNYTLTVENGTITSGQKDVYSYADRVTVTADASKDGKYFSGWYVGDTLVSQKQVYTFYMLGDMTVTAKYEDSTAIEEQPVLSLQMSERQAVSGTDYNKVKITVQWSLPENCILKEAGILRSYDSVNEDALILDKADGVSIRKNASSLSNKNGTYVCNLTMSTATKLKTVSARGYLVYTDSEGKEYVMYTGISTSVYTGI